jgi:Smg protein
MFDILVYLFENYFEIELQPDHGKLTRELSAAGYDSDDISKAFDWFQGLKTLSQETGYGALSSSDSLRCYAGPEQRKLDTESQGLLAFLESSGILSAQQRECVLDRVFALSEPEVSPEQVKWIVLMVLWSTGQDYVFMEDFLTGDAGSQLH